MALRATGDERTRAATPRTKVERKIFIFIKAVERKKEWRRRQKVQKKLRIQRAGEAVDRRKTETLKSKPLRAE